MPKFRSDDRVLALAMPPVSEAAALGRILMAGCLVMLGSADEVDEARRQLSEFDNLMFIVATPDRIPWREAFFTKVLVPPRLRQLLPGLGNELSRVLAPGGEIIADSEDA